MKAASKKKVKVKESKRIKKQTNKQKTLKKTSTTTLVISDLIAYADKAIEILLL